MPGPEIDKLVVLARGLGTRMRRADDAAALDRRQAAAADAGIKALIPLDGQKPGKGAGDFFRRAGRFSITSFRRRPRRASAAYAW